jgi:hypothetical protein
VIPLLLLEIGGMFSISTDEENYSSGPFETIEKAIEEAVDGHGYERFWIGETVAPEQPEALWTAEHWLEYVSETEDYMSEWAEGWDAASKSQREELETEVRQVMAKWLDRHKLRPTFWNIGKTWEYIVEDGVAVLKFERPAYA